MKEGGLTIGGWLTGQVQIFTSDATQYIKIVRTSSDSINSTVSRKKSHLLY